MALWWAYLHEYGSIEVKEWYPGNNYLNEARVSPHVENFLKKPFEAETYSDAKIKAQLFFEHGIGQL